MQAHICWKASFSVRESCLCNFKSKAWVHERCFFLMKLKCYCNAEDRFNVLELVCRASYVRASMHRITSELLRTLIVYAILRVKLEYMKDFFSWNEMYLQWEDRF